MVMYGRCPVTTIHFGAQPKLPHTNRLLPFHKCKMRQQIGRGI
eukprot:jgi/Mesvir1/17252/Mv26422-RA.1